MAMFDTIMATLDIRLLPHTATPVRHCAWSQALMTRLMSAVLPAAHLTDKDALVGRCRILLRLLIVCGGCLHFTLHPAGWFLCEAAKHLLQAAPPEQYPARTHSMIAASSSRVGSKCVNLDYTSAMHE